MMDMIDDATRQVMERQGWSEQTLLVLALRFINDRDIHDEWFAMLLEAAMEESPDVMDDDLTITDQEMAEGLEALFGDEEDE